MRSGQNNQVSTLPLMCEALSTSNADSAHLICSPTPTPLAQPTPHGDISNLSKVQIGVEC